MEKTITVRGTGHYSSAPDAIHVKFSLVSRNSDYSEAMSLATSRQKDMSDAIERVGIPRTSIKTSRFTVSTEKKTLSHRDETRYVFDCYAVHQGFFLELDFDLTRLGEVLTAISASCSDPDLSVSFTVKDTEAVRDAILASAAAEALSSAQTLCKALGVKLGDLISINYSWTELDIVSGMDCDIGCVGGSAPEINPEDVKASDSVTFVWALKD